MKWPAVNKYGIICLNAARWRSQSPSRSAQAIAELDTLQCYLLGVSHSDKAQMNLLSVEQFIERTMHYATDYALFSCTAIETMDMAKAC